MKVLNRIRLIMILLVVIFVWVDEERGSDASQSFQMSELIQISGAGVNPATFCQNLTQPIKRKAPTVSTNWISNYDRNEDHH